jgi:hypothetical protein
MVDYFYRFLDQATMFLLLTPLGMVSEDADGNPSLIEGNHQYAAWQVGEISGYDGWHLNVRQIDPEFDLSSLTAYEVFPPNPVCVWA